MKIDVQFMRRSTLEQNDDPSKWRQKRQNAVDDRRRVFQLEKEL